MRMLKLALVAAFTVTASIGLSAVGQNGAVEAKAHVTKGSPGKCGVGKYYSRKDKGCVMK